MLYWQWRICISELNLQLVYVRVERRQNLFHHEKCGCGKSENVQVRKGGKWGDWHFGLESRKWAFI